ncbi:MAG: MSMEG_1061 family FMN-dependent PPOX-type flavoprotein [Actinomycetota bacterium]
MEFTDAITTVDQLREVLAPPSEFVTDKETDALDEHGRDFIDRSPFILIASTDGEGRVDISPKGDPPGFVRVLDDTTIAIPDRPGNHRADTFENVLRHPYVSVIFLVPGTKFTLRIRGRATIVRDRPLRESMAVDGRVPELALVVELTTAFFHCGKCIIRSGLWSSADGLAERDERLLAESMADQLGDIVTTDVMQEIILDDEAKRLY